MMLPRNWISVPYIMKEPAMKAYGGTLLRLLFKDVSRHDVDEPEHQSTIDKPMFICEYAHAMGNAIGNLTEYWEIIESSNTSARWLYLGLG